VEIAGTVTIAPFEDNLVYDVYDSDLVRLAQGPLMVDAPGPGAPGAFAFSLDAYSLDYLGPVLVTISDISAADGSLLAMDSVDPQHRSLGQFFQDEIASPLGIDFYIRLPEEIPDSRLAPLQRPGSAKMLLSLFTLPPSLALAGMRPGSNLRRALLGSELPEQAAEGRVFARELEIPAGGGVGTARAIARAYSEFVAGGMSLGLRDETLRQIMARPVPPVHGFEDECLTLEVAFSLGFMKPEGLNRFAHPSAFGAPGFGGSFGFGDPHAGLGWAYVTNRIGKMIDDPRELVVRKAVYATIGADGHERE